MKGGVNDSLANIIFYNLEFILIHYQTILRLNNKYEESFDALIYLIKTLILVANWS